MKIRRVVGILKDHLIAIISRIELNYVLESTMLRLCDSNLAKILNRDSEF